MRKTLPLLLSCAGSLLFASSAAADSLNFGGATPDAASVFFSSDQQYVAADTDSKIDVYQRSGGVTTLVSVAGVGATPPLQDATFAGVTPDGSKVFFHTAESLVTADTDGGQNDVYQRSAGVTTLISAPGLGSSGTPQTANFKGVSADGATVIFDTKENLVTADTDGFRDVYQRNGVTTSLLSGPGAGASGSPADSNTRHVSSDGSVVDFDTSENLVAADADGLVDIYEASGGTTTLVSGVGAGANGPAATAFFRGATADGGTVFFDTDENLVTADADGLEDVYQRSGGTTTLVSEPGAGATAPAAFEAFGGMSADGSTVFFDSPENLVGTDTDGLNDVYEHSGGVTTLSSAEAAGASGPIEKVDYLGNSADGSTVFFDTDENFAAADIDGLFDTYKRSGGTTTLVSPPGVGASGPADDANFEGNSADGSTVFLNTDEKLVAADTDGARDLYQNTSGVTTLVTAPGSGASGSPADMFFRGASTDASRVIFTTGERLTGSDGDTFFDLYQRASGTTTLISAEAGPPLGLAPNTAISSGPPSSGEDTTPTFSFTSTEPATFQCRMDGAAFTPCSSPFTSPSLGVGAHTFAVRSTDLALNVDPSPATLAFAVVTPPPPPPATVTPPTTTTPTKHCKKGRKLKKGKCVKKKHKK
jgi:hypothetical protein